MKCTNINQAEPINAPLTPAIDGVEEEKLVKTVNLNDLPL